MIWLLAGIAALFVLLFLLRWFTETPPEKITKVAAALGLGVIGLICTVLVISGRIGPAILLGGAVGGWLLRQLMRGGITGAGAGSGMRRGSGRMTRKDALATLGLEGQPDEKQINDAYHRLIKKMHPDQGGNAFLAAQINEARQVLLDDLKGR